MVTRKIKTVVAVFTVWATITPTPAFAYIDPGTGGLLIQLLLGGLAGALVIVKLYWSRLKAFFAGGDRDKEPGHKRE